jgi:hypothetical protein
MKRGKPVTDHDSPLCFVLSAYRAGLSRRSFSEDGSLGEGGCSMKITEDVRKFAAEQGITGEAVIQKGLKDKSAEFAAKGGDVYAKA